ncbi:Cholinesterase [Dactylellina cionopaga]|nr:Cholinesterase [Dactylellina cionopaga]
MYFSLKIILLCATFATSVTCDSCCASPSFPIVDLGYARHAPTKVNQTLLYNISYASYENIRFAQPPVGDLRFRAPKLPPPTSPGIQNGTYPRNATNCIIAIPSDLTVAPGVNGTTWGNEDCLFLTVKVPEGLEGKKVPVLHWLYGGGYIFGSSDDWAGNPAGLFQEMPPDEKFITVSSNYRLGALGWMSSPGVDMAPNAGLWDALVALEWTKEYISYFGGDPDRITVIGESAGGGMLQHLLTLRGGNGTVPFNQAILTSPGYRPHVNRSAAMTELYNDFLDATNCSDIKCLRGLSSHAIADANKDLLFNVPREGWLGPSIGYGPIIDGDLVTGVPDQLLLEGKYHKSVKKVLTANMAADGFAATSSNATTWEDFLKIWMTNPTPEVIKIANATWPNITGVALDTFAQDAIYACHAYWTAKTWGSNAYRYSMSIPPAFHGQDQFYYFYVNGTYEQTSVEFPNIARQMETYFRRFILESYIGGGEQVCKDKDDGKSDKSKTITPTPTPQHWPAYGSLQR